LLAPDVCYTHWSPSDHLPVFTRLSINTTPLPPPTLHSFRRLHSIDVGSFLTDLKSSQLITDPPKLLGPLLSSCNTTLRHAENIWKRTHFATDWSSFKSLRNQYHKFILSSKMSTIPASYFQPPITRAPLANSQTNVHPYLFPQSPILSTSPSLPASFIPL